MYAGKGPEMDVVVFVEPLLVAVGTSTMAAVVVDDVVTAYDANELHNIIVIVIYSLYKCNNKTCSNNT